MQVIDYFYDFQKYYKKDASVYELLDCWSNYMNNKQEIKDKCISDYQNNGIDYKEIAYHKVFKLTHQNIDKMYVAYQNLLSIMSTLIEVIEKQVNINLDIDLMIYHGLGNGAGWAGKVNGRYGILFGVEKIAELNWHTLDKLEALVSHEVCHMIHYHLKPYEEIKKHYQSSLYDKGIWQLYVEGFAQYYQSKLLNKQVESRDKSWLENCFNQQDKLKKIYFRQLYDDKNGCNDFFGDWNQVLGISDAGYFLGERLIEGIAKRMTLQEVALLNGKELETIVIKFLESEK